MPSKIQIAVAKVRARKKLKELEKALEASDSSLIERILGKITLPIPEKGKDGERGLDAPQMSDILEAVTPLLPETKIEHTTVVEKLDPAEMEDFIKGFLPETKPEDRPVVEQITNTIDVSDEKLEGFVSQEEMKQHLIKIQRAITASQSGGGGATPEVGPIVNLIEADQATNVVLVTDLDTSKINIVHATVASSTVQLPAISSSYIVWVEDAVSGGGNITITREA